MSDRAQELEEAWLKCLHELHIPSAALLAAGTDDSARRAYLDGDLVYKCRLRGRGSVGPARRNTLRDEYVLMKRCEGIDGVVCPVEYRGLGGLETLVTVFVDGHNLSDLRPGLFRLCFIIQRLVIILCRVSLRGVSHHDITSSNVRVTSTGKVYLLDFDQSRLAPCWEAALVNIFGVPRRHARVCNSLLGLARSQAKLRLPGWMRQRLRTVAKALRPNPAIRPLPKLPPNAEPMLQLLLHAWMLAQRSRANAPGAGICYYSLKIGGYTFPGERPWLRRWKYLKRVTRYRGKRVLELGCNLGLLSCYLLKQEGASASLGVDRDSEILAAARLVAQAFDVPAAFCLHEFDSVERWEEELAAFNPDVVFALSVMNWVSDKKRFVEFLGRFQEVIVEGHEDLDVEVGRLRGVGFDLFETVAVSERYRPVVRCRKQVCVD